MATVNFLIRRKNSKKPTSIYYDVCISSKHRLRGSTKIKVEPRYWDERKQEIKNVVALSNTKDAQNQKLAKLKSKVLDHVKKTETYDNDELYEELKYEIDIYLGKTKRKKKMTLHSYIDKFIEQSDGKINESTGKAISVRTIQDYKRTHELMKSFEKSENYSLSFESINLDFYYKFKFYLEKKEFSANTIGKFIKVIKVFLNAATEEGHNQNLQFRNKNFLKPSVQSDNIYLNSDEINKIIKLDLSKRPLLDNARDLFLIGCYTGLRVSDFNGLTKDSINKFKGKRFFNLHVKKTGKYISIPIHPVVEKILKKNNGHPPKKMRPQDINDQLAVIGKKAEILDLVKVRTTKAGVSEVKLIPKNQLIKNHTARRSFCTNAYISGMSTLDIMAISGHRTEKSFLNYIKITTDERALKIAENSFFK